MKVYQVVDDFNWKGVDPYEDHERGTITCGVFTSAELAVEWIRKIDSARLFYNPYYMPNGLYIENNGDYWLNRVLNDEITGAGEGITLSRTVYIAHDWDRIEHRFTINELELI